MSSDGGRGQRSILQETVPHYQHTNTSGGLTKPRSHILSHTATQRAMLQLSATRRRSRAGPLPKAEAASHRSASRRSSSHFSKLLGGESGHLVYSFVCYHIWSLLYIDVQNKNEFLEGGAEFSASPDINVSHREKQKQPWKMLESGPQTQHWICGSFI